MRSISLDYAKLSNNSNEKLYGTNYETYTNPQLVPENVVIECKDGGVTLTFKYLNYSSLVENVERAIDEVNRSIDLNIGVVSKKVYEIVLREPVLLEMYAEQSGDLIFQKFKSKLESIINKQKPYISNHQFISLIITKYGKDIVSMINELKPRG